MTQYFSRPTNKDAVCSSTKNRVGDQLDQRQRKWDISHHDYYQLINDTAYDGYDDLTLEEAKEIYGDILPDVELFDRQDKLRNFRKQPTDEVNTP